VDDDARIVTRPPDGARASGRTSLV